MPQITIDITDAQLKQIDGLNASRNKGLEAGAAKSSRQTFAAAAFGAALESAIAEEAKAKAKTQTKDQVKKD